MRLLARPDGYLAGDRAAFAVPRDLRHQRVTEVLVRLERRTHKHTLRRSRNGGLAVNRELGVFRQVDYQGCGCLPIFSEIEVGRIVERSVMSSITA